MLSYADAESARVWLSDNEKQIQLQTEKLREQGVLDQFDEESISNGTKRYTDVAELIATESTNKLEKALLVDSNQHGQQFEDAKPGSSAFAEELAVFVSFSMSESELISAFRMASDAGAKVYFKGLHPEHKQINETIALLSRIGSSLKRKPFARFNPNAFEEYNVKNVPAILYRKGTNVFTAAGIVNLRWIKGKSLEYDSSTDFGNYGPVKPVIERSLLDEIKSRLSKVDFAAEQKRTMKSYWTRKTFSELPRALKNETWYIDPTVKATNDVVNPRGDVLAVKGQVINPLDSKIRTVSPLTLIVFDGLDNRQIEWVTRYLNEAKTVGQLMLISSRLNKTEGWDHLAALRRHFRGDIYLLPESMVSKFQLSGLPATVETDLTSRTLKVSQFNVEE